MKIASRRVIRIRLAKIKIWSVVAGVAGHVKLLTKQLRKRQRAWDYDRNWNGALVVRDERLLFGVVARMPGDDNKSQNKKS